MSTVDLEAPTDEDAEWLKEILNEFVDKTGSEVGAKILKEFPVALKRFIKVCSCGF